MKAQYTFISCVKTKLGHPAQAKELYISPLFRKALEYAIPRTEGGVENIYILSAKYGLIHSSAVISPYEQTLKAEKKEERIRWAKRVLSQMLQYGIPYGGRIMILAGSLYREYLIKALPHAYCPIKGLSMGNILKYYNNTPKL